MISPPNWAKDAVPTTKGWVRGRELLKSQRITETEISEYMGTKSTPVYLSEAPSHKPVAEMTTAEVSDIIAELTDGLSINKGTKVTDAPTGVKGKKKGDFSGPKSLISE